MNTGQKQTVQVPVMLQIDVPPGKDSQQKSDFIRQVIEELNRQPLRRQPYNLRIKL